MNNHSKNQSISTLAKGAGVSVFGRFIGGGIALLNQVAFARFLGAELFGLFSIGWTLLRLLQLLSPLGVDKATIKFGSPHFGSNHKMLKRILRDTACFTVITGSLTGLGLFFLSPWLANTIFNKPPLTTIFQFFSATLPIASIGRVVAISTRISQKMHYSVISEEIIQPTVTFISFIIICFMGGKLFGAVIATTIGFCFSFFYSIFYLKKIISDVCKNAHISEEIVCDDEYDRKKFLYFSLATFLAGTFLILSNRIDRLIVGAMLTANDVGVYQAISQLCGFVPLVLAGFGSIITPMISTLYYQNKSAELREIYIVSTKWGLYLTLPLILTLSLMPAQILAILFGEDYRAGGLVFLIMLLGQFVAITTGAVSPLMIMTGHQRFWLHASSVTFLINVVMTWFLVGIWGLKGAAIANSLAISILYIGGLIYIKKMMGIWPFDIRYWKMILAGIITFIILYFSQWLDIKNETIEFILTLIISFLGFSSCLLIVGLDHEDKSFLKDLYRKIFSNSQK